VEFGAERENGSPQRLLRGRRGHREEKRREEKRYRVKSLKFGVDGAPASERGRYKIVGFILTWPLGFELSTF